MESAAPGTSSTLAGRRASGPGSRRFCRLGQKKRPAHCVIGAAPVAAHILPGPSQRPLLRSVGAARGTRPPNGVGRTATRPAKVRGTSPALRWDLQGGDARSVAPDDDGFSGATECLPGRALCRHSQGPSANRSLTVPATSRLRCSSSCLCCYKT